MATKLVQACRGEWEVFRRVALIGAIGKDGKGAAYVFNGDEGPDHG